MVLLIQRGCTLPHDGLAESKTLGLQTYRCSDSSQEREVWPRSWLVGLYSTSLTRVKVAKLISSSHWNKTCLQTVLQDVCFKESGKLLYFCNFEKNNKNLLWFLVWSFDQLRHRSLLRYADCLFVCSVDHQHNTTSEPPEWHWHNI